MTTPWTQGCSVTVKKHCRAQAQRGVPMAVTGGVLGLCGVRTFRFGFKHVTTGICAPHTTSHVPPLHPCAAKSRVPRHPAIPQPLPLQQAAQQQQQQQQQQQRVGAVVVQARPCCGSRDRKRLVRATKRTVGHFCTMELQCKACSTWKWPAQNPTQTSQLC